MERRRLVETLGPAVRGGGTAYLALADALRGLVLDGRLLVGDALPPERTLAAALGTSRATVTAALTLLRTEGLLDSRRGSGTVVAAAPVAAERPDEPAPRRGAAPTADDRGRIDLTVAAPNAPALLGPLAVEAAGRLAGHLAGHGLHPLGLPELRDAVARRFTARGLPTGRDQVLVTQGALHGWDLLLRAYARPGAPVAVEQPTYAGAADAAHAHGVRPLPIGVDTDGWSPPGRGAVPVLALVTPDHQNPTGVHATTRARRALLQALPATRVVADETFAELDLDPVPARPPLAALRRDVITVGSLSKLVWAGLRIGWVRAPADVVARLGGVRGGQDLAAPVLDQLLAVGVFEHLEQVRTERVALLRPRRDHLLAEVTAAGWAAARPTGGLVLWADLGPDGRSTPLAAAARAHGVRVTPGPRHSLTGTHERWIRLPYCLPEPVLTEALARLRRAAADAGHPAGAAPRWTA